MCPKCRGRMHRTFEEPSCINCGFILFDILTLAASYAEAEIRRGTTSTDGRRSDVGKHHEPYRLAG